jgi:hypothetical protein
MVRKIQFGEQKNWWKHRENIGCSFKCILKVGVEESIVNTTTRQSAE